MGCVDDTRGHVLTVGLGVAAARFSVSPVVRVALKAPKQHQNAQLHNAVRAYSKTDPCVQHHVDPETHELVLAGAGELHLEVAVTSIGMLTGFGAPVVSQPVVSYRETVRETSEVVLAKSSNKLNRLFIRASPLDATLVASLESGDIDTDDATATARVLAKECVVALRVFWCSWLGCHRVLTPLRSRSVQIRLGSAPRQAHLVLGRQRRRSWRSHQRPGGLHHRRPEPPCHQGQRHQRLPTGVRCWRSGFGAPAWRQVRLDGRHGPSRPCPSRPQPDRPSCVPCFQGGAAGRQPSAGAADVPVHGATPRGVPGSSTERRCRSLRSGGRVQRCGGYSSGACTLQGKRGGAHSLTGAVFSSTLLAACPWPSRLASQEMCEACRQAEHAPRWNSTPGRKSTVPCGHRTPLPLPRKAARRTAPALALALALEQLRQLLVPLRQLSWLRRSGSARTSRWLSQLPTRTGMSCDVCRATARGDDVFNDGCVCVCVIVLARHPLHHKFVHGCSACHHSMRCG